MRENTFITALDYIRIRACIAQLEDDETRTVYGHLRELTALLDAAVVQMDLATIPPDIITMRSEFNLINTRTGETTACTLVYPEETTPGGKGISITTPMGSAMLGRRTGNIVEVGTGEGTVQYRVGEVSYQPEAAGDCQR